jgi:hypothetical protein
MEDWQDARNAIRDRGWTGNFRQIPTVFGVPFEMEFAYGFAIKQPDNGTTYVASPVPLPHLES